MQDLWQASINGFDFRVESKYHDFNAPIIQKTAKSTEVFHKLNTSIPDSYCRDCQTH